MLIDLTNEIDENLMLLVKKGNVEAFRILLKRHKKYVLNLCFGFIPDKFLAEDASQEVFLRVYRSAPRYKVKAKFTTWLSTIAINYCCNEYKKYKKDRQVKEPETGIQNIKDNNLNPEESLDYKENNDKTEKALAMLTKEHRAVIVLGIYQGLKYEEISKILKISVSAVKMRINRARLAFKDIWESSSFKEGNYGMQPEKKDEM
jgi:RNA polymerase sigma-70 factor (ECF subfamily)